MVVEQARQCPKCGVPYDIRKKKCLLCGMAIDEAQSQTPKSERVQEIENQLKATQVDDDKVPPFDGKGGFSKRNNKKDVEVGQIRADNEALRRELSNFEELYRKEHPEAKPWYTSFGNWFALLLVLGMVYLIYRLATIPNILPPEAYELLRRIRF